MNHRVFGGCAVTLALGVALAALAGAAEARAAPDDGARAGVSRQPVRVTRDHRAPSGAAQGGVAVGTTPSRSGGSGRHPVVRDHRGGCERGVRRPGGCAS
jgi:hypothetical protein